MERGNECAVSRDPSSVLYLSQIFAQEVGISAENAHKILDIYAHFKGGPGHLLVSNHFLAVGNRRRWRAADLQDGIETAHSRGWIKPGERGWLLTQEGFEEAVKSLAV